MVKYPSTEPEARTVPISFVVFTLMICAASPVICYVVDAQSGDWLRGYKFGFELLILNGLLTFLGLCMIRERAVTVNPVLAHV